MADSILERLLGFQDYARDELADFENQRTGEINEGFDAAVGRGTDSMLAFGNDPGDTAFGQTERDLSLSDFMDELLGLRIGSEMATSGSIVDLLTRQAQQTGQMSMQEMEAGVGMVSKRDMPRKSIQGLPKSGVPNMPDFSNIPAGGGASEVISFNPRLSGGAGATINPGYIGGTHSLATGQNTTV